MLSPDHKAVISGVFASGNRTDVRWDSAELSHRGVRKSQSAVGTNRRTEGRRLMSGRTAYLAVGAARYGR
jgi:hypothetical protein